ncbi:uncharacterized protein HMPREF1541_08470 [Cyphellophora europaea CBS 101466]|uniref:Uncharacterized protein n=1 Tax=Cyphellophora europaea (strain CBS 101466) TaxID=1220924 RepID=W2RKE0_CYPE1|nr:uncharacterized protein HMPREF1541_08470 [Cyphellophora europaea CBS 101466]ETN36193.1 hypothetical protein HMPREF1541_08470 [Cyphellophora europaea CBS 101466]
MITGAGAGIGLSIVKGLLEAQTVSLVVAVDLAIDELQVLASSRPGKLVAVSGDVSDRLVNKKAIDTVIRTRGKLDSLILNAAVLRPVGPTAEINVEEWKRLIDVNFIALVHAIQLALPHLRKSRGQVLFTSSGVAARPFPAWIPYACSKASVNCLASCLTVEENQVSFLCITPGIVDSGMQRHVRDNEKSNLPPDQYKWLASLHAEGKLLRPEEPAGSFVKLALGGVPKVLNGLVVPWDDPRLVC